jgi:fructose-1,6-bisphosphatase/inositol monophosphatase family enzyme
MVTVISKKDNIMIAEKSIMNFPALGEIYFTEKGKGVWLERHSSNLAGVLRVRVSGIGELRNSLISTSYSNIDLARTISSHIRVFESYSYDLALLVSGKIDMIIAEPRAVSALGTELFVMEAAGSYFLKDGLIIASNFKLHEEIKALL